MPLDINLPLPTGSEEGDEAWILSAEQVNLLTRKINAFYGIQAQLPLRIVKAEAGMKIVVDE
jgi:hypothetical protein